MFLHRGSIWVPQFSDNREVSHKNGYHLQVLWVIFTQWIHFFEILKKIINSCRNGLKGLKVDILWMIYASWIQWRHLFWPQTFHLLPTDLHKRKINKITVRTYLYRSLDRSANFLYFFNPKPILKTRKMYLSNKTKKSGKIKKFYQRQPCKKCQF